MWVECVDSPLEASSGAACGPGARVSKPGSGGPPGRATAEHEETLQVLKAREFGERVFVVEFHKGIFPELLASYLHLGILLAHLNQFLKSEDPEVV